MRAQGEDRGCALGDIWDNHHEPTASCLGHPSETHGDLAVPAARPQDQVQVEIGISPVQKLGEQGCAVRIDLVDHDGQVAAVLLLVPLDQGARK